MSVAFVGQAHSAFTCFALAPIVAATLFFLSGCEDLPSGPVTDYGATVQGITFADWSVDGYATPEAQASLAQLAATGASHVVVVITAYQENAGAERPIVDPFRTASSQSVATVASTASGLGLELILKPHVDLNDGSWRGRIHPGDPDAWFSAYTEFVVGWAGRAQNWGASHFVVGTELAGTLEHEDRWRRLIEQIRGVFGGQLLYAASWDEADKVPFWDVLDLVGIDFYFPVSRRRNASRIEILSGWQMWSNRIERLAHRAGRPVLLSEIGYRSVDGAGMKPYEFVQDAPIDLQEQADLYWAMLEATKDKDWLDGILVWNWLANGNGSRDATDYTPKGKPAVAELSAAWGGDS